MPLLGTSGALAARAYRANIARQAIHINTYAVVPAHNVVIPFTGASAGDLAIITLVLTTITPPAGWTYSTALWPSLGYRDQVFTKVLTGGEIAAGLATDWGVATGDNPAPILVSIWRDATSAVVHALDYSGPPITTLPMTSFAKNTLLDKTLVSYVFDRDNASRPVRPAGWTARIPFHVEGPFFMGAIASLPAFRYASGTQPTWTGASGAFGFTGRILVLR